MNESQHATLLYNRHGEERAGWLNEVFARTPAFLLENGKLSATSVSLVLEREMGLSEESAMTESIEWLRAPSEAQLTLMSAEDANEARVQLYELRRYAGESDEEE